MVWSQLVLAGAVREGIAGIVVTQWLRDARAATRRLDVSGGLLFDGEAWLQLFEGPDDAVRQLMRMACAVPALGAHPDPAWAQAAGGRACVGWTCGFLEPEALLALRRACAGSAAPALFAAALLAADAS